MHVLVAFNVSLKFQISWGAAVFIEFACPVKTQIAERICVVGGKSSMVEEKAVELEFSM